MAQVAVLCQLYDEFPSGEVSFNEYDVLFNLARQPGRGSRFRDLSRHLRLTQPSVSRLVDRLVGRDLVTKQSDPGDGRGTIVWLTTTGYSVFRKVAVVHAESISARVGGALTGDEFRSLTVFCGKLRLDPK